MRGAGALARACAPAPRHSLKRARGDERVREEVHLRVMQAAEHILETGATVRACAREFGVSKTTIHKDVTERLKQIDSELAARTQQVLERNKRERHIRGGRVTREKYLRRRESGEE